MENKNWNGFARIGNNTLDDLIDDKTINYKMRVYLLTVRKLNGYSQGEDRIPVSQYVKRLGIDERYAKRLLKQLKKEGRIHRNDSITSIPGDYIQWADSGKNLPPPGVVNILQKGGKKLPLKQWQKVTTLNTKIRNINTKGNFYQKLSGKEISKLEGDPWYKAIMFNQGKFSIFYIEGTISDYPFNTRMSCWYSYQEARNVRDKEAYFSHLLRDYQEDLTE